MIGGIAVGIEVAGTADAPIVGRGHVGPHGFTQIRQAWRVNIPDARFDIIPVKGIVCEDPGS